VDTILHLAKVLRFTRDRRVVADLCRTIHLLEPLVDHALLTGEQKSSLTESEKTPPGLRIDKGLQPLDNSHKGLKPLALTSVRSVRDLCL
jgi:hypothetical protein